MMLRIRGISSMQSRMMIRWFFVLLVGVSNIRRVEALSISESSPSPATIPALDHKSMSIYSESFLTILEVFDTSTVLNISHVQLETFLSSSSSSPSNNPSIIPQYLHLVLVYLPPDCVKDNTTTKTDGTPLCDFQTLGIGKRIQTSYPRGQQNFERIEWCCTMTLQQQGECQDLSQLIIVPEIFQGQDDFVEVPQTVNTKFVVGESAGTFDIFQTGHYALLLANCKEDGLDLRSIPRLRTQDFMEEFQDYYICLTFYHFFLFVAFVFAMMVVQNAKVLSIQKWLAITMGIAALDTLFLCINYDVYNDQTISWFNAFTVSVVIGVLKRGISMVVGVMVAKGWGRVRYRLGTGDLVVLGMMGFLYTGILFFDKVSNAILETNLQQEIMVQGGDLTAMGFIFAVMIFVMDIIFVVWIGMSIRSTIVHLKSTMTAGDDGDGREPLREQVSHHRVLGGLLTLCVLVMAPAWMIQFMDNERRQEGSPPLLTNDQWNYMNATIQGIYAITLTGVAALWIPKQQQRREAQENGTEMKELHAGNPNNGDTQDVDEGEEADLWTGDNDGDGAVPSKDDDSGNDPDHPNGLPVNFGQLS